MKLILLSSMHFLLGAAIVISTACLIGFAAATIIAFFRGFIRPKNFLLCLMYLSMGCIASIGAISCYFFHMYLGTHYQIGRLAIFLGGIYPGILGIRIIHNYIEIAWNQTSPTDPVDPENEAQMEQLIGRLLIGLSKILICPLGIWCVVICWQWHLWAFLAGLFTLGMGFLPVATISLILHSSWTKLVLLGAGLLLVAILRDFGFWLIGKEKEAELFQEK